MVSIAVNRLTYYLQELLLLLCLPLLSSLPGLLNLVPSGLGLVSQLLGPGLLSLLLVDVLHEDSLVLEHVTLGLQVELVIQVAVDLLGLTVATEQATKDTHALHPEGLLGTSVRYQHTIKHRSLKNR